MSSRLIAVIGCLVLFVMTSTTSYVMAKKKKVLIYTKNGAGFVHDNIPNSIKVITKLCLDNNIEVEASEDPSLFTEQNLKQYDALIFSNTNNGIFDNDEQKLAFQRYIQAGGSFVGIHSACGSERQWPWFWKMLGGKFKRHAPSQNFMVKVIDADHPSTEFLPGSFERINDECYYLNHLNPDIHVLLAADMTSVEDKKKNEYPFDIYGNYFPIAWSHQFDGGNQWYTAIGHRIDHYDDPTFQKHLLGGIQWAIDARKKLDYTHTTTKLIID
ncbi:MAG: type 1 glutamine amidotransferase [Cyclobacteriaceae bacterium]|jgi:type 1 glutamine amidotransferase